MSPAHALPHAPQLLESVCVSAQAIGPLNEPGHCVRPNGQSQLPSMQIEPAVHMRPHAPQLVGSVFVSMHPEKNKPAQ
jgi:hypothetical protein